MTDQTQRDDLDSLLGIDPSDPTQRLANALVAADYDLIASLVKIREAQGLTCAQVAERMGTCELAVGELEAVDSDPRLSTLRRYALAIGATVEHRAALTNPSTEETTK